MPIRRNFIAATNY